MTMYDAVDPTDRIGLTPLLGDEPAFAAELAEVSPESFRESFGEDLHATLDVGTWRSGQDLAALYDRLEHEVRTAVAHEDEVCRRIRAVVFPRLADWAEAPPGAGVYACSLEGVRFAHRHILFAGQVDACDGNCAVHDTLPLTVYQFGVSLTNYAGDQGTWNQRLFRRDLRAAVADPTEELLQLLERRERRSGLNRGSRRDQLSELSRRSIVACAERAILLQRSQAPWRLGHGSPAPYELLSGGGSFDLMVEGTAIVRELVEGHRQFVFVASEPVDRLLLSIGQALRPLEYAIVRTLRDDIERIVERGRYAGQPRHDRTWDGDRIGFAEWAQRFRDRVAPQVVVGVYRASAVAPAHVFYAHADHAEAAAHIAVADSQLHEYRGFPLLLDLADTVCRGALGAETLLGPIAHAYSTAGAPWRYLSERVTRG